MFALENINANEEIEVAFLLKGIRNINIKTAILLGLCFYTLIILIHTLVISGILPYTWVNGGRSESFEAQIKISFISIIISIMGGLFTIFAGENKAVRFKRSVAVLSRFIVVLCFLGFIQQLLGTTFEKLVCSFIVLLGIISNLRLAVETRRL
ncbi:hypothetical protein SFC66_12350 [Terribacillus saccharophilus]|uniref:hypothetical protein n=1 Tax=Terribacillus saccharophilus TaxID=361277 RepID=UPI00398238B1